jgi:hypothetical protein
MIAAAVAASIVLATPLLPQDVDVDPAPWSPDVHIEVERREPPTASRSRAAPAPEVKLVDGFVPSPWIIMNCTITETTTDCPEPPPATSTPPRRQVTEGDVRRAVSEIPMPALDVKVQPAGRSLVNVPTILFTDPDPVRETVTLLGREVDVEATPTRYTWHHGDGTTRTTTRPGRPYPAKDVTHTYRRTADDLRVRVDTTYTVRYRIDGGDWTDLGTTLTANGTPTTVDVDEAAPVLVRRR